MKHANIKIIGDVCWDSSTSVNNVELRNNVKIAKNCSIFGSENEQLIIGENTYIGMNTIINGFSAKITISNNVSIAQNVNIMSDSGPNASLILQKKFPIEKKEVFIGQHCWIGAGVVILPGTTLEDYCVVGANSVVNGYFKKGSVIVGSPARIAKVVNYD
tara:strand:+ start:10720 stop:11199 length:480 start_codon:yes stop_codon:yes gene_type:complete